MSTAKLTDQAKEITLQHEQRVDPVQLTHNDEDPSTNAKTGVDYEPHPATSIKLSPERQEVLESICRLYSGSARDAKQGENDCSVYAEAAIYDDPWSYCDTRRKIAGQWYGIPMIMAKSETIKTEVVSNEPDHLVFKLQQAYTPKVLHLTKTVNSLVTLTFDAQGKVKYHKDQWNENKRQFMVAFHSDFTNRTTPTKVFKTLNGDYLPAITKPAESL